MYPQFDRNRLRIEPLARRQHDVFHDSLLSLDHTPAPLADDTMRKIELLASRIRAARDQEATVLLIMGAHVIRAGVARQLIDLMQRGWITHLAMNGAGPIHDYELARIGATCESVARYISSGQFGLWRETAEINDVVREAAQQGLGLGQAIGQAIVDSDYPHRDTSVLAAAVRLGIPVSVHVGIGYDILHEHPNFDPAAFGIASYRDFLTLCDSVERLENGVFICAGSAVMGPEVYLKALAMARNVAHQENRVIQHFTTAVFDLLPLQGDLQQEAQRGTPEYFFRPWKTILVRTVADGGESLYVQGTHRQTIPQLRQAILRG